VPHISTQNKLGVKINKVTSMRINCLNHIHCTPTHLKQTFSHQQHTILQSTQTSRAKQKISAAYSSFYKVLSHFYNYYSLDFSIKNPDP